MRMILNINLSSFPLTHDGSSNACHTQRDGRGTVRFNLGPAGNVFMFFDDLDAAIGWYSEFLGTTPARPMPQLAIFDLGGTRLTLHAADEFNAPAPGTNGSVAYFDVPDIAPVLEWCEANGAKAHRGPKSIFSGETLLQIEDPFGNLFGVRVPPIRAFRL